MRVLVAVASKHGATREIGEAIRTTLEAAGIEVDLLDPADVDSVARFDAFVLGSAVYAGHWLKEARELVADHAAAFAARPTWLFSSGPVGDPPKPDDEHAVEIHEIASATAAREHRVFAGKLDRQALGFAERAIMTALRAPEGDFRDWAAIERWAGEIAEALKA